jgi:regulator of sirC expression with transglutaminase-like and TPR domain
MNQQGPDSIPRQQGHDHESAMHALLGTDPVQRQALAARFVRQWQQEAEQCVEQRHYQKAVEVYARILVVDPEHAQALRGRAKAYRQAGMEKPQNSMNDPRDGQRDTSK